MRKKHTNIIITTFALVLGFCSILTSPITAYSADKVDTRELSMKPKEVYGDANAAITVRIGNGGAGPTGILRDLAENYLSLNKNAKAIAWYQDISPNTLKNLQRGTIDIALVYEKNQGDLAIKEGWATNYTPIFNDHFIIIGPKENPANIAKGDSAEQSFAKIAKIGAVKSQKIFLSRDDNSGTNIKEQSIWRMAKQEPWAENTSWYVKSHVFPKDALIQADNESIYTITDWATWVSNQHLLKNSTIYVQGGKLLLNPCFALLGKSPSQETLQFLDYLKGPIAQKRIAEFSKEGKALFTPAAQAEFN